MIVPKLRQIYINSILLVVGEYIDSIVQAPAGEIVVKPFRIHATHIKRILPFQLQIDGLRRHGMDPHDKHQKKHHLNSTSHSVTI